jgi:HPt (histidine-containing phosphotransfer) domain-containing protein
LADGPSVAPALDEIGRISHKIAGTAATLGFPELGADASVIDDLIDRTGAANGTESACWLLCDLRDMITRLDALIAAVGRAQLA